MVKTADMERRIHLNTGPWTKLLEDLWLQRRILMF